MSSTPGSGTLGALPIQSAFASQAATPRAPAGLPTHPFSGTPATNWAAGAAGIVIPKASATGAFTVTQVASAYQTTRKILIAANLNTQTTLGGKPTAFADLLTSPERSQFLAGLDRKGTGNTRSWVLSLLPGSTQLVTSTIKVHGSMRAKATTDQGSAVLEVTLDYIFAYAIEPPHQPTRWMRLVVQDTGSVEFGAWQGVSSTFAPWTDISMSVAGVACDPTADGYWVPEYPSAPGAASPRASDTASGTPVDPYVMTGGNVSAGCQEATGT